MKSAEDYSKELQSGYEGHLDLEQFIRAIQSDARESALREAAEKCREAKTGRALDVVYEAFAASILDLIPKGP